ncbi:MAG: DUF3552 domain-containing protein, partial [Paludibacteraceae bacterium]|nr:DUF3552 domain-containing protein [Paludibacteraceae bacterium]
MSTIIFTTVSLLAGIAGGWTISVLSSRAKMRRMMADAESEAENLKKKKLLEVKEKFFNLKSEHDKQVVANNAKMQQRELSLNQRQGELQRRSNELDATRKNLDSQLQLLDEKRKDLERSQKQVTDQLAAISGLSPEDAKAQLIESL